MKCATIPEDSVFYTQGGFMRRADTQYRDNLAHILEFGELVRDTPQGIGALTAMTVPKMHFELEHGFPLITERSLASFWRTPINELFAFIRGETTFSGLTRAGCGWWDQWKESAKRIGLPPDSLGPASYGGAFAHFPTPDGSEFNQFAHIISQIRKFPGARTHFVTPWIPFWLDRGANQKAVIAPCHGWVHFRVTNGKLTLHMIQRSADFPVGVPANMVQYSALLLAMADLLDLTPHRYVHSFSDAHIYENQIPAVQSMLLRDSRPLPQVRLVRKVTDLFEVDGDWFEVSDYNPHPGIKIPVAT